MTVRITTLLIIGLVTLVISACGAISDPTSGLATTQIDVIDEITAADIESFLTLSKNSDGYIDVTSEQLAAVLGNDALTVVNVHIPDDGGLPETDLEIPFNTIAEFGDDLPAKDAPIVLYCRSGNMSTQAAETLVQLGYTNVFELDGGFNTWRSEGYEFLPPDQ